MKQLIQWTHTHPLKAIGFAVLSTMIAMYASFTPSQIWPCITAFCMVLGVFAFVYVLDHRVLVILLCGCIFTMNLSATCFAFTGEEEPPPPPVESPTGVGCAVAILVIGGVIIYSVSKFCQKHFSPPPKGPNTNATYTASSQGSSSAASWNNSSCGSCETPTIRGVVNSETPTTFEIIGQVTEDEYQAPLVVIHTARLASVQTNTMLFSEYQAAIAEHGIIITEHGQGEMYYGLEGQPTTADQVPISFNTADGSVTVSNGSPAGEVVIERSSDMFKWETVLHTYISQGFGFRFVDTSLAGQTFFRVSTK